MGLVVPFPVGKMISVVKKRKKGSDLTGKKIKNLAFEPQEENPLQPNQPS